MRRKSCLSHETGAAQVALELQIALVVLHSKMDPEGVVVGVNATAVLAAKLGSLTANFWRRRGVWVLRCLVALYVVLQDSLAADVAQDGSVASAIVRPDGGQGCLDRLAVVARAAVFANCVRGEREAGGVGACRRRTRFRLQRDSFLRLVPPSSAASVQVFQMSRQVLKFYSLVAKCAGHRTVDGPGVRVQGLDRGSSKTATGLGTCAPSRDFLDSPLPPLDRRFPFGGAGGSGSRSRYDELANGLKAAFVPRRRSAKEPRRRRGRGRTSRRRRR